MNFFEELLQDNPDSISGLINSGTTSLISPIFPFTHALNFAAYHNLLNVIPLLTPLNFPQTNLSAIHYAALTDSFQVLPLITLNASPIQLSTPISPLHIAAIYNAVNCARLLLDFANVNTKYEFMGLESGLNALEIAIKFRSKKVVELLFLIEKTDDQALLECLDFEGQFGVENRIKIDFLNLRVVGDYVQYNCQQQPLEYEPVFDNGVEQTPNQDTQVITSELDGTFLVEDFRSENEQLRQENVRLIAENEALRAQNQHSAEKLIARRTPLQKGRMQGRKK
ncbi:Ankyrin repeat-containing protein [Spironucleus salmonicida]|uniref:Ankyrin repeat-containing protein n=1 Tax=Spironucleus salmonicida TaxID=348837 RepID=V6LG10_9EUKA|nr:Ankyrin repeat-containing protein [Spironucleus salmonicida]|eukprot:EST43447.1 Ankyrin repeat-containing protein [Spironucleus salmonicida]